MRKKDLIAENKKLKDEVEDLKRQLTYAKTQIDIKDICLMDKILDKMSVDKNTESEIDRLLEGVTINGD